MRILSPFKRLRLPLRAIAMVLIAIFLVWSWLQQPASVAPAAPPAIEYLWA